VLTPRKDWFPISTQMVKVKTPYISHFPPCPMCSPSCLHNLWPEGYVRSPVIYMAHLCTLLSTLCEWVPVTCLYHAVKANGCTFMQIGRVLSCVGYSRIHCERLEDMWSEEHSVVFKDLENKGRAFPLSNLQSSFSSVWASFKAKSLSWQCSMAPG